MANDKVPYGPTDKNSYNDGVYNSNETPQSDYDKWFDEMFGDYLGINDDDFLIRMRNSQFALTWYDMLMNRDAYESSWNNFWNPTKYNTALLEAQAKAYEHMGDIFKEYQDYQLKTPLTQKLELADAGINTAFADVAGGNSFEQTETDFPEGMYNSLLDNGAETAIQAIGTIGQVIGLALSCFNAAAGAVVSFASAAAQRAATEATEMDTAHKLLALHKSYVDYIKENPTITHEILSLDDSSLVNDLMVDPNTNEAFGGQLKTGVLSTARSFLQGNTGNKILDKIIKDANPAVFGSKGYKTSRKKENIENIATEIEDEVTTSAYNGTDHAALAETSKQFVSLYYSTVLAEKQTQKFMAEVNRKIGQSQMAQALYNEDYFGNLDGKIAALSINDKIYLQRSYYAYQKPLQLFFNNAVVQPLLQEAAKGNYYATQMLASMGSNGNYKINLDIDANLGMNLGIKGFGIGLNVGGKVSAALGSGASVPTM